MKQPRAVLIAALLILPRVLVGQQAKVESKSAPTAAEAAAVAAEQAVLQAVLRGDAPAFIAAAGLPTLIVGGDGISSWTGDAVRAFMKACTTTSATASDVSSVGVGENVVVLAYRNEGKQRCQGQPTPDQVNALSVWQRKGNRWSVVAHSEVPAVDPRVAAIEAVYQYLPPMKGLAVYRDGYFNFLFGPADGSGAMTANAGKYEFVGDTIVGTVLFSTNPNAQPGARFRWLSRMAGDTSIYTLIDAAGRPTGGGRALRLR